MSIKEIVKDEHYKVNVPGLLRPDGTRKRYVRHVHGRQRQAEKVERELYALREKESEVYSGDQTIAEYVDSFLAEKKRTGHQPGTIRHYTESLKGKLVPLRGTMKIKDFTPTHMRKLFEELEHGGKDGALLSGTTRHGIEADIKALFTQAYHDRLIPYDPGDGVKKTPMDRAERMALSPKDGAAFLAHVAGTVVEVPALLMYCTGIRPQEMLGLRMQDCDLQSDEPTIHTVMAMTVEDDKPTLKKVKTKRSNRVLRIDRALADRMLAYREKVDAIRKRVGPMWVETPVFFPSLSATYKDRTVGGLWSPTAFKHAWNRARKPNEKKGKPKDWSHVMPYTMRHTFITQRLAEGVRLEVVSRLAGHASSAVTADHYSHVLKGEVADVVVPLPKIGKSA